MLATYAFVELNINKKRFASLDTPSNKILAFVPVDKRGMNHPDAGPNAQFLLNIIHCWIGKLQKHPGRRDAPLAEQGPSGLSPVRLGSLLVPSLTNDER
jgi:hypothetical protein